MRHFLRAALAPGALASSVSRRATVAVLVALPSTAPRLAPAKRRAIPGAVLITAVAVPTDEHLLRAAPAAVHPIRLLACPHPPPAALDNAADCGHKGNANVPLCARACRRPGVLSRNLPGPSLIRRPGLRIAGRLLDLDEARASLIRRVGFNPRRAFDSLRQRPLDAHAHAHRTQRLLSAKTR